MPSVDRLVGRVGVRIIPDTSHFREDLKRNLDALDNAESVNVDVSLDGSDVQRQARRLSEDVERGIGPLKIRADLSDVDEVRRAIERVGEVAKDLGRQSLTYKVDPDSLDEARKELLGLVDGAAVMIKVAEDEATLRAAAARIDAELLKKRTVEVAVDADVASLTSRKAEIEDAIRALSKRTITLSISDDVAGLERVARQVAQQLQEATAAKVEVSLDENSLRDAQADILARLAEATERASREPVLVTMDVDRSSVASIKRAMADLGKVLNKSAVVQMTVDSADPGMARKALDDLQRMLRDAQSSTPLTVDVVPGDIESYRRAVRAINDAIADREKLTIDVGADVESMRKVRDDFEKLISDYDGANVKIDAEASTLPAKMELAWLTRPRTVTVFATVSKKSLMQVASAFSSLSGARMAWSVLDDWREWLQDLDKAVPKIGALTAGVTNLASWLLSSVSNTFSLALGLGRIGALGLALPGTFAGAAFGVGALVAVLKDFNAALPEVGDRFSALQDSMSDNFWGVAAAPMREMIDSLLPQLSAGLDGTALALGGFFAALSTAFNGVLSGELQGMFDGLNAAIREGATGASDYAQIVAVLGRQGASLLPQFAGWVVDIANAWADWLTEAEATGRLNDMIQTGADNLVALGNVLIETTGIIAGLGRAAEAAGGSTLQSLAEELQHIHDVVDSAGFQDGMTKTFMSAHLAMQEITDRAGPALIDFFDTFANVAIEAFPAAGAALGDMLDGMAKAFGSESFTSSVVQFFNDLALGAQRLQPMWQPLADSIGVVLELLGTMVKSFAPVLSSMFGALAPVFDKVMTAMRPVIEAMSTEFSKAIDAAAPSLELLGDAFITVLEAMGDSAPTVFQALADVFVALNTALAPLVESLGVFLVDAFVALMPLAADLIGALLPGLSDVLSSVVDALRPVFEMLPEWLPTLSQYFENIGEFLPLVGDLLAGIVSGFVDHLPEMIQLSNDWFEAMEQSWPALMDLWEASVGLAVALTPLAFALLPSLVQVIEEWVPLISDLAQGFADLVKKMQPLIEASIPVFIALLGSVITTVEWTLKAIQWLVSVLVDGLRWALEHVSRDVSLTIDVIRVFGRAILEMTQGVRSGVDSAVGFLSGMKDRIAGVFSGVNTWLVDSGKSLLQGFADGITSGAKAARDAAAAAVASVRRYFPNSPAKEGAFSGSGWVDRSGEAVSAAFADGLRRRASDAVSAAASLAARVQSAVNGAGGGDVSVVQQVLNYTAAPGRSLDAEDDLIAAMRRGRMVWG